LGGGVDKHVREYWRIRDWRLVRRVI